MDPSKRKMSCLSFAVVLSLMCAPAHAQDSNFFLTATFTPRANAFFAVYAAGSGKVTFSKGAVSVALSGVSLISNPKYEKAQRIKSYSVCLATGEWDTSNWEPRNCSKEIRLDRSMKPGSSEPIPDNSFLIDVRNVKSYERTWLVIALKTASGSLMFTQSQKDLFE
jgi:hypothetical protein